MRELGGFIVGLVFGTGVACILFGISWMKLDRWLDKHWDNDE